MRKSRRLFYRRHFLNRPNHHGGAYVIASIERRRGTDGGTWLCADLVLADCDRVITLVFGDDANSLRKAKLLRDVLTEFTAELKSARAELKS